jgi:hypothetical protein
LESVVDKDCSKLNSEFSDDALRSPEPVVEPVEAVPAEVVDAADEDDEFCAVCDVASVPLALCAACAELSPLEPTVWRASLESVVDKDCSKPISEFSDAELRSPEPVVEPAEAVVAEVEDVVDADDEGDNSDRGDVDDVDDEANPDCRLCPALGNCCTLVFAAEASWACMLCWSCCQ